MDPDSSVVHLLVKERACRCHADGERLLGPQVIETADAVLVAFAATTPPGEQTCPDDPPTPVTIVLSEPLGERPVRDGLIVTTDLVDYVD